MGKVLFRIFESFKRSVDYANHPDKVLEFCSKDCLSSVDKKNILKSKT